MDETSKEQSPFVTEPKEESPKKEPSQEFIGGEVKTTAEEPEKKSWLLYAVIAAGALLIILAMIFFVTTLKDSDRPLVVDRSKIETIQVDGSTLKVATDCGGFACFKDNFAKCKKSRLEGSSPEDIVYLYDILGKESGLCQVKFKFIEGVDEAFLYKEMVCGVDNSLEFETAVTDDSHCSGELFELLQALETR